MNPRNDNPTLGEIFHNLTSNLYLIKSCKMEATNELKIYYKRNDILTYIHKFRINTAIAYIDTSLNEIDEVAALGDKVVSNIKLYADGDQEGLSYAMEERVTLADAKQRAYSYIQHYLKTNKEMLTELKADLLNRKQKLQNNMAGRKPKAIKDGQIKSFRYIYYDTKLSNLAALLKGLVENNLVPKETSLHDFRRLFSDSTIEKPVRWQGNQSEFAYFIKLICTEYKKVEPVNLVNWKTACTCFVQADGTPFDKDKMRGQKKPASHKLLEKLASRL